VNADSGLGRCIHGHLHEERGGDMLLSGGWNAILLRLDTATLVSGLDTG
jgi:hypothetical protein